jgi:hypothetical protein
MVTEANNIPDEIPGMGEDVIFIDLDGFELVPGKRLLRRSVSFIDAPGVPGEIETNLLAYGDIPDCG